VLIQNAFSLTVMPVPLLPGSVFRKTIGTALDG
jgi:hypothetical protein